MGNKTSCFSISIPNSSKKIITFLSRFFLCFREMEKKKTSGWKEVAVKRTCCFTWSDVASSTNSQPFDNVNWFYTTSEFISFVLFHSSNHSSIVYSRWDASITSGNNENLCAQWLEVFSLFSLFCLNFLGNSIGENCICGIIEKNINLVGRWGIRARLCNPSIPSSSFCSWWVFDPKLLPAFERLFAVIRSSAYR